MPKSRWIFSFKRMEQAGRTAGEGYSAVVMGRTRQGSPASCMIADAKSAQEQMPSFVKW